MLHIGLAIVLLHWYYRLSWAPWFFLYFILRMTLVFEGWCWIPRGLYRQLQNKVHLDTTGAGSPSSYLALITCPPLPSSPCMLVTPTDKPLHQTVTSPVSVEVDHKRNTRDGCSSSRPTACWDKQFFFSVSLTPVGSAGVSSQMSPPSSFLTPQKQR